MHIAVLAVLLTVPVQTLAVITFRPPRHCGTAALRIFSSFEIKNFITINYIYNLLDIVNRRNYCGCCVWSTFGEFKKQNSHIPSKLAVPQCRTAESIAVTAFRQHRDVITSEKIAVPTPTEANFNLCYKLINLNQALSWLTLDAQRL